MTNGLFPPLHQHLRSGPPLPTPLLSLSFVYWALCRNGVGSYHIEENARRGKEWGGNVVRTTFLLPGKRRCHFSSENCSLLGRGWVNHLTPPLLGNGEFSTPKEREGRGGEKGKGCGTDFFLSLFSSRKKSRLQLGKGRRFKHLVLARVERKSRWEDSKGFWMTRLSGPTCHYPPSQSPLFPSSALPWLLVMLRPLTASCPRLKGAATAGTPGQHRHYFLVSAGKFAQYYRPSTEWAHRVHNL